MLKTKTIVEEAIRNHKTWLQLSSCVPWNDVYQTIKSVMRENPDIFWFSHQWKYNEADGVVHFHYTMDADRCEKIKAQIDDVVEHDFKIAHVRSLPKVEQVMYVYKWIALYCSYNILSAHNQTIYSVFVHRTSVCTGIAKAAQYLLNLLGIESRLVFGKMANSPKNSRHCWIIVKIENKWYHLDPTFALPDTEYILLTSNVVLLKGPDYLLYNYFCIDTKNIKQSRSIEEENTLPNCIDTIDCEEYWNIDVTPSRNGRNGGLGCLLSDSGTTADIYLAHDKDIHSRRHCVAKVFRNDEDRELLRKELIVMRECAGRAHLLRATDADFDKGILYMEQTTPFAELLASSYFELREDDLCCLLIDIASGLRELLAHGIYYRDIHLNNIYLSDTMDDGHYIYKLGDFGSCAFVDKDGKYSRITTKGGVGSKWYMAPETWERGVFDERSAVYGVGMIAYFLLNNLCPPFWTPLVIEESLKRRYNGETIPETHTINNKQAETLFNALLYKLLAYSPETRLQTLYEVINEIRSIRVFEEYKKIKIPCAEGSFSFEKTVPMTSFRDIENTTCSPPRDNYVCASVECPNCGTVYYINILQDVVDKMLLSLPADNANGNLELPVNNSLQHIYCPRCGFSTTPKECMHANTLSLPAQNTFSRHDMSFSHDKKRNRIDEFATTEIPCITRNHYSKNADERLESFFPQAGKKTENICDIIRVPSPCKSTPTTCSKTPRFGGVKRILDFLFNRDSKQQRANGKKMFTEQHYGHDNHNSSYKVNSSVFAPSEAKHGEYMMVQVFLYMDKEEQTVSRKAKEVDGEAERRNYIPLSVKLKEGDKVKVFLQIPNKDVKVEEPTQELTWQGRFTDCQFAVYINKDFSASTLLSTVVLSINNSPVGRMMFKTKIADNPRALYAEVECKTFKKIFISYSHKDEARVKYIAEAYKAQGVDYFFDRHYLKAGDIYPAKIRQYIDSADLFILCWSKNAAESDYVALERNQALSHAYPQVSMDKASISIHPISIEPRTAYPQDMNDVYNFEEV